MFVEKNYKTNRKLHGVIEWILSRGGTIKQFNHFVITGKINDLTYRYFVSEGWITYHSDKESGAYRPAYETLKDFKLAVKNNSTKICDNTIE